jgi:uncharacterized FlgJ-related protein
MASAKGTDATENDRALRRGVNLVSALEKDFYEKCNVVTSAYVVNLGRHTGDHEQDDPKQRRVIALVNDSGEGDEEAVAVALATYLKSHSEFDNYTVCDLFKLNNDNQQTSGEIKHKACGDQSTGTASLR